MPKFERSRERKSDSRSRAPSRGSRSDFKDRPRGDSRGSSDRGPKRFSSRRRDLEMTEVTCSSCGVKCEVPFKPTSNKPVYCSDCFTKKEKNGSGKSSNRELDLINEKLDKILKALNID